MSIDNPKYQKMLGDLLAVCRRNLPKVNEDLVTKAFEFALEAHKHDLRASGEPYFSHPYEVALIVAEEFTAVVQQVQRRVFGDVGIWRKRDFISVIEVPVFCGGIEGKVGFVEADRQ